MTFVLNYRVLLTAGITTMYSCSRNAEPEVHFNQWYNLPVDTIARDKNDFSVITRFLHIAVVQGDQPLTEFFIQRMKSRGIDIYNKLRQVGGSLATSFPGSLNLPPPGAIEVREEERPWERGWRRIHSCTTLRTSQCHFL